MPLTRRGFALIELVVATLLGSVVVILTGKLLLESGAILRGRAERMGLENSLRVSAGAARAMLEPLGIDGGSGSDFAAGGPFSLVARVVRGSGVLCDAAVDRLIVRAGPEWWRGLRAPVKDRDSLIVASIAGGEQWIVAPLVDNPASGICSDGSPGLVLPTAFPPSSLTSVGPGSPLQVFEPVEFRLYSSSGANWIGLRLVATGAAVQPLAGPFAAAGPGFDYRDRQGNPAPAAIDVTLLTLSLEGLTERAGGVGVARLDQVHSDSVHLAVALRGLK